MYFFSNDVSNFSDVDFSKEVFMLAEIMSENEVIPIIIMNNDQFGDGYDDSKTSGSNIVSF